MNNDLYLACDGGRLLTLNIKTGRTTLIYQHPTAQAMMGLAFSKGKVFFAGQTFLGVGAIVQGKVDVENISEFFPLNWKKFYQIMRGFWAKFVGSESRALNYVNPQFHHMKLYQNKLYVAVTGRNEIWELSENLDLLGRLIIHPHIEDYHHMNNVYFDGKYYYVCLARYMKDLGPGGFAKFDENWVEIERQSLGWESHGLCVIEGKFYHLCSSSGVLKSPIFHPHRAGLMVNDELVFEYDADKYFCKDFSIDDQHIFIAGGEIKQRAERKNAKGVVFQLNRQFDLMKMHIIPQSGGIGGCHLSELDYTVGSKLNKLS